MKTFIVGTDTDVGKSYYGKLLMEQGKSVIKPIETGYNSFEDINDSDSYQYANGQGLPIHKVNRYFFQEPVSPHFACEIDHASIDIEDLRSFVNQYDTVTIELAGGLMVPIIGKYTQLDFIRSFPHANVDLVLGNKLGCLNHGLMTISILNQYNIPIQNLVINNLGKEVTPMMINNIETLKSYVHENTHVTVID